MMQVFWYRFCTQRRASHLSMHGFKNVPGQKQVDTGKSLNTAATCNTTTEDKEMIFCVCDKTSFSLLPPWKQKLYLNKFKGNGM